MRFILVTLVLTIVVSCSSPKATYFRRHDTSLEQERIDWGLCGGDFFENGAPAKKIFDCMRGKGYKAINDYYAETMVSWLKRESPDEVFFRQADLIECGARKVDGRVCEHSAFLLSSDMRRVNQCMWEKGYAMTQPRYKLGVRVFDDISDVDKLFCLYLTPANNKPAVSLGMWRLE